MCGKPENIHLDICVIVNGSAYLLYNVFIHITNEAINEFLVDQLLYQIEWFQFNCSIKVLIQLVS